MMQRFMRRILIAMLLLVFAGGCASTRLATDEEAGSEGPNAGKPVSLEEGKPDVDDLKKRLKKMASEQKSDRKEMARVDKDLGEMRREIYEHALAIRNIKQRTDAWIHDDAAAIDLDTVKKLRDDLFQTGLKIREVKQTADESLSRQKALEVSLNARDRDIQQILEYIDKPGVFDRPDAAQASRAGAGSGKSPPASTISSPAISLVAEGNRLLARGQIDEAKAAFERAVGMNSGLLSARLGLAACLFSSGDMTQARQLVEGVLALDPDNAQGLGLLGVLQWRDVDLRNAESTLKKAVKLEPANAQFRNYLGIVQSDRRRTSSAIKSLRMAVELNPEYAEAHYNLAFVLATQSRPDLEKARVHYNRSIQLGSSPDANLEARLNQD